jgi:hypothetical protein
MTGFALRLERHRPAFHLDAAWMLLLGILALLPSLGSAG